MRKEQFHITGMTCSACSSRVEGCVVELPGVKDVSVNLLKNSMVVIHVNKIAGFGSNTVACLRDVMTEDLVALRYTSMDKMKPCRFLCRFLGWEPHSAKTKKA